MTTEVTGRERPVGDAADPSRSRWRRAASWRLPRAWRERTDWVPTDRPLGQLLRTLRWAAIVAYLIVLVYQWSEHGVPFGRSDLLFWIAIGLGCVCIGRHPVWMLWIVIDFAPFAAVLVAYDYLRGLSDTVGMPTWWHPQIDVDRFLFFGHEPTVWLQEHLKHARFTGVRWYDVVVCVCYYSFFFLPYITAGVMWLRSRVDFYRWSLRFVGLSFFGFTLFLLIPAAPPWAAALCTPADVANHPNDPMCMHYAAQAVPGNLLGPFTTAQPGANPYVERIAGDAFHLLHLGVARTIWTEGFDAVDAVAAVPSLHLGGTVLFVLFMWSRLNKWWRPLLVAYPLVMTFSLAYAGEHYVADCIAGALSAFGVHYAATWIERRRKRRRDTADGPDTLVSAQESDPDLEAACPPTETTPSST